MSFNSDNVKIKGDDANVIYKSIVINDDRFLDKVIQMLDNKMHEQARKEINRMINWIRNAHDDPDWEYDLSFEGNEVFVTEKPKNFNKYQPERLQVRVNIPDEYKDFSNLNEIIRYGQNKQKTIDFDLLEYKLFYEDHLIEHKRSNDNQYILRIPPTPFPILECKIILGDLYINNVWIQVTQVIDENNKILEISNKNQPDKDIFLVMIMDFNTGAGKLTINVPDENKGNVASNLIFAKFLYMSQREVCLKALLQENDRLIFQTNVQCENQNISDKDIKLLEYIQDLEETFNVKFDLPEIIEQEDIDKISKAITIIKHGQIESTIEGGIYCDIEDLEGLNNIVDACEQQKGITIEHKDEEKIELFSQTLDLGLARYVYPPCVVNNIEIIKQKLKVMTPGDSIKITLTPINEGEKVYTIYEKFCKSS